MRRANDQVKIFPSYLNGEDLFGLTEPVVLRIIESVSESNTRIVLVLVYSIYTRLYPIYTPFIVTIYFIINYIYILLQLPGVELLSNTYQFRYGRNPLIEVPLTINPSGCARSEPRLRQCFFKRYVTRYVEGRGGGGWGWRNELISTIQIQWFLFFLIISSLPDMSNDVV